VAVGQARDLSFVIDRLTARGPQSRTTKGHMPLPYDLMIDPKRIGAVEHSAGVRAPPPSWCATSGCGRA
jgi:hypothetical protein